MTMASVKAINRTLSSYATFLKKELREEIKKRKKQKKEFETKAEGFKFMVDFKEGEISGLEFMLWELKENII